MDKTDQFKTITEDMVKLYAAKNHDYGDSFSKTFRELGIISAVTRMWDKLYRITNLTKTDSRVASEKIEDTLIDLANYAIMTIIELHEPKK